MITVSFFDDHNSGKMKFALFFFLAGATIAPLVSAFSINFGLTQRGNNGAQLSMSSIAASNPSGVLPMLLKKPSKTLTVNVEYDYRSTSEDFKKPNSIDLEVLSTQLRKANCGSIWTADLEALAIFAREQETARGEFPGPCPVIYCGDADGIAAAADAGAVAVVLGADKTDWATNTASSDIVWKVSSPEDVNTVLEIQENADAFLISGDDLEATIAAIPSKAVVIGAIEAMQDENSEIEDGRALKIAGCSSVLLNGAIIGDSEDLPYTAFAIGRLTTKASSEFNFSGLTGSTNGHFGGLASSGANRWKRNLATSLVSNPNALEEVVSSNLAEPESWGNDKEGDEAEVGEVEGDVIEVSSEIEEAAPQDSDQEPVLQLESAEEPAEVESPIENLSDAALYFLSSSGFQANVSDDKANSALSAIREREEKARKQYVEKFGLPAETEEDDA